MSLTPLAACPAPVLAAVRLVLTDIDDTLTLHGRLPAAAYEALSDLRAAGCHIVPITGRPAGWCDLIARQWPVDGVVGENGAFAFRYDATARRMIRIYAQSADERSRNGVKLRATADEVLKDFPGAAFAADQAYREIDVAIDFCEDVPPLPLAAAQAIAARFQRAGAQAKVSSIHVNAWFGSHDKLTMTRRFLAEALDIRLESARGIIAFCGDSPNDAPMFAAVPLGIGVANVKAFTGMMEALPAYVTQAEGGEGFAEFARAVLAAKRRST